MDDERIAYVHAYRIKKKLDLKKRKEVYKRANYRCEDCNRDLCCPTCRKPLNSRILLLYHEDGNLNNNELTNLLLLCKDCRLVRRQKVRDKEFFTRIAKNSVDKTHSLEQNLDQDIEKLSKLYKLISQQGINSDPVRNLLKEEHLLFRNYRSPSELYQFLLSLDRSRSIEQ